MGNTVKNIANQLGKFSPVVQLAEGNGWNGVRDSVESTGVLAGNYYLPGSGLVTSHLVSKGSQGDLNSPVGQIGMIGSGLAGAGVGSSVTGIPAASDVGAGWTGLANGVGSLVGAPTAGTDASSSLSSLLSGGKSAAGALPTTAEGADADSFAPLDNASGTASLANTATPSTAGGGLSSYGPLASALLGGYNTQQANSQAQKDLVNAENSGLGALQPYLKSGTAANGALSTALGTGGDPNAPGYGSLTKPFSPGDLTQDPGYEFQLQQGDQALNRKEAAAGNFFSGSALKAAQDYGQGLAGTTYNAAFQRNQAQKQQDYSMLAGQNGAGQQAAGTAAGLYEGIGNAQANSQIASSNATNQTLSSLLSGGRTLGNGLAIFDPLTGKRLNGVAS